MPSKKVNQKKKIAATESKISNKSKADTLELVTKDKPPVLQSYAKMNNAINSNLTDIECIREMFQIVVPVLEKQDEMRTKKVNDTVFALHEKLKDRKKKRKKSSEIDPRIFREIVDMANTIKRINRATSIFKCNAIVSLVSRYDEFIGSVIRIILLTYPEKLNNSDKTLTMAEIVDQKDIAQIVDRFIDKEVEKVLRESHGAHFKYIEDQLKIQLREKSDVWSNFIELTERRNLIVHCGGIISSQYIAVCKKNNVTLDDETSEGKPLNIDDVYFEKAFRTIFEISLKLGQTVYRKIFPDNLSEADSSLVAIGYDYLIAEQWAIANIVFDYALSLSHKWISSDDYHKTFIINKCIVLKFSGDKQGFQGLIDSVDWSSSSAKYLLAVDVLKENFDHAAKIMKTMNGKDPVDEQGFREWPLFREFRKTDQFKRSYKFIYKKEFDEIVTVDNIQITKSTI